MTIYKEKASPLLQGPCCAPKEGQFWGLRPRSRQDVKVKRRGGAAASGQQSILGHFRQDVDEVVQPEQVAILAVPFLPGHIV